MSDWRDPSDWPSLDWPRHDDGASRAEESRQRPAWVEAPRPDWGAGQVPPGWAPDASSWVTWGGSLSRTTVPLGGQPSLEEIARIECPTPRAITIALSATGVPPGAASIVVVSGIGRVEAQGADVGIGVNGTTVQLTVPGRIVRVLLRITPAPGAPTPFTASAVLAPVFPWL